MVCLIKINRRVPVGKERGYFIIDKALRLCSVNKKKGYIIKTEKDKCISIVKKIVQDMIHHQIRRDGKVISVGGGVCSDIAGFVSSIYLRGIKYISIPSTLLSQVDASVGSKNGINLTVKNIVGTFYNPSKVLMSVFFIRRLPNEIYRDGFSEIIKIAIINNANLFSYIWKKRKELYLRRYNFLKSIVIESVISKLNIVNKDRKEEGHRMVLNLGHTIGHAVERYFRYTLSHGACVWYGIYVVANISLRVGVLQRKVYTKIISMISNVCALNMLCRSADIDKIFKYICHDKKSYDKTVYFIIIKDIGSCKIRRIKQTVLRKMFVSLKRILCV
ncbi:3-dehydroquinate synthase [Candidatus Vidania fulgoroideorum]